MMLTTCLAHLGHLQVGLGKTLVALAASRQPRAPVTHLGKQLDDEWSDDLLNGEREVGREGGQRQAHASMGCLLLLLMDALGSMGYADMPW
jgi:hypothetical protein